MLVLLKDCEILYFVIISDGNFENLQFMYIVLVDYLETDISITKIECKNEN